MKQFAMVVGLCILAFMTWRLAMSLSSDALGMGVGVVFGILAGVPMGLLVLASQRAQARRERYGDDDDRRPGAFYVITNTTNNTDNRRQLTIHPPAAGGMPLITDRQREVAGGRSERRFKVVGELEEEQPGYKGLWDD